MGCAGSSEEGSNSRTNNKKYESSGHELSSDDTNDDSQQHQRRPPTPPPRSKNNWMLESENEKAQSDAKSPDPVRPTIDDVDDDAEGPDDGTRVTSFHNSASPSRTGSIRKKSSLVMSGSFSANGSFGSPGGASSPAAGGGGGCSSPFNRQGKSRIAGTTSFAADNENAAGDRLAQSQDCDEIHLVDDGDGDGTSDSTARNGSFASDSPSSRKPQLKRKQSRLASLIATNVDDEDV